MPPPLGQLNCRLMVLFYNLSSTAVDAAPAGCS